MQKNFVNLLYIINIIQKLKMAKVKQVESDGKTVWVNDEKGCMARFTNNAGEVRNADGTMSGTISETWEDWVTRVFVLFEIQVSRKHKPVGC